MFRKFTAVIPNPGRSISCFRECERTLLIPDEVVQTIAGSTLPCFVYGGAAVRQRATVASSLLDRYFFPVKACPEPDIVRAAVAAGCDLDLCSAGDVEIAAGVGVRAGAGGKLWKLSELFSRSEVPD